MNFEEFAEYLAPSQVSNHCTVAHPGLQRPTATSWRRNPTDTIKYKSMETDDEVEVPLHAFINLALDGAAPSGGEGPARSRCVPDVRTTADIFGFFRCRTSQITVTLRRVTRPVKSGPENGNFQESRNLYKILIGTRCCLEDGNLYGSVALIDICRVEITYAICCSMFWAEVNITDISLKTFLRSANITAPHETENGRESWAVKWSLPVHWVSPQANQKTQDRISGNPGENRNVCLECKPTTLALHRSVSG
jgi:hypothetical protein